MKIKRSFKVGKYLGIDVYLHYSWFFIFLLLAYGLATGWFPQKWPGESAAAYWGLGIVAALLLYVSVLLHELSHSVVARRNGIHVEKITLFLFGGMAGMRDGKMTPKTEFQMAIAGPALSLVLSGLFLAVYNMTSFFYVAAVAAYLWRLNLILAVFNLVPGFPLDGGRVFRSIAWYWTKDYTKATRMATLGGKVFAYILIFIGFANIFAGSLGGVWFVAIGFFLLMLTTLSYEQLLIKDALSGVKVKEFVVKRFSSVKPDMSLKEAVGRFMGNKVNDNCPVIDDGMFVGILSFSAIKALPKKEIGRKKVSDVMTPMSRVGVVSENTGAYTALLRMLKKGLELMPVSRRKDLAGIVLRDDILRYVKIKTTQKKFQNMNYRFN